MKDISLESLYKSAVLNAKSITEAEYDDIPYAEEIPDENLPSSINKLDKTLTDIKEEYAKAKRYVEFEAVKLMSGTTLIDLIKDTDLARNKEKELEKANDYYDKRCRYYDDKIDEFHEEYGYRDEKVNEISKYNAALGKISSDMYDAAQVWYKLKDIVDDIMESYEEDKSMKPFVNLKSVEL